MSKQSLKKELQTLDKEQIIQLILDAYSARKETKEYLEFFLNPDINKLTEKYRMAIFSEFNRKHRVHYCKARISVIRKLLKEYSSFQPGFENEIELMLKTIQYALLVETSLHFPDTLILGISSIMTQVIDLADKNLVADKIIERLTTTFADKRRGSINFRTFLNNNLTAYHTQLAR